MVLHLMSILLHKCLFPNCSGHFWYKINCSNPFPVSFFYLNCLKSCGKIWLTHRIFFPVSWKIFPKNHWEFIKTESENSKKICPTHRKRFFLWVGQIFPVSWTNFFRVLTLSFYWSCKQLFQLSCPSGLLLAIIKYFYDSLKF